MMRFIRNLAQMFTFLSYITLPSDHDRAERYMLGLYKENP